MAKTYNIVLGKGGLASTIRSLEAYRDNGLRAKARQFTNELAQIGIDVAEGQMTSNRYKDYIRFSKRVVIDDKEHRIVLMYGKNIKMMKRTWLKTGTGNATGESVVNPILMAEFGSGINANTSGLKNVSGLGGRGTHPTQVHANDKGGWWWYEEKGDPTSDRTTWSYDTPSNNREKHFSRGEEPARPMYEALHKMQEQIIATAKKVYG